MEIMETSSSDTGSGSYNNGHNGVTNSSDGDDVNSNHITQCSNKYPADIYLIKFNNRNNRKRCEICSKLTIKHRSNATLMTSFWCIFHTFS